MAADPQDASGTPGRSSAACRSAGTSSSTRKLPSSWPPPSRRRSNPVRPPSGRAKGRVFHPPAASGCSDMAAATRLGRGS